MFLIPSLKSQQNIFIKSRIYEYYTPIVWVGVIPPPTRFKMFNSISFTIKSYKLFKKGGLIMHWALQNPDRFKSEVWLMNQNTGAKLYRLTDGRLRWIERIINNYCDQFLIAITYPNNFPTQPPVATVLKPEIPPNDSYHYFDILGICALPSSQYSPGITAYSIRNRACEWALFYGMYCRYGKWYGPQH